MHQVSDFDAFETIAAFFLVVIGAVQLVIFAFFALKRLGRRSRSDASRYRRAADRPSSARF